MFAAIEVAERPVLLRHQHVRILRRDAPVLALERKRIGRSADAGALAIERLVGPRLGSAGVHAHGVVAVKADRHAELAAERLRLAQLLVGKPLQPGMELDQARVRLLESLNAGVRRFAQFLGPHRPAPVAVTIDGTHVLVDGIVQRMPPQRFAAFSAVGLELRGACRRLR